MQTRLLVTMLATAGLVACSGGGATPAPSAILGVASTPAPSPPASAASPAAATSTGPMELASTRAQLEATLATASGCSTDAQCRSVATGAKACGGPTAWRAYSSQGADPRAVADLAQHERELAMIEARESGRVSACYMLADPGARCLKNRCVTGRAASTR